MMRVTAFFIKVSILLVVLLLPATLLAQGGDDDNILIDSVVENSSSYHFDTISQSAPPLTLRPLDTGLIKKLKNDAGFDYVKTGIAKQPARSEGKTYKPISFKSSIIFFIILAIAALAVLWFFKNSIWQRNSRALHEEGTEDATDDIFAIDYNSAIANAENKNDYRLAIRLGYLQVLKQLAERHLINYSPEKTNQAYVWQMQGKSYYQDFFSITRHYEYSWYGLFTVNAGLYRQIKGSMQSFHQTIARA